MERSVPRREEIETEDGGWEWYGKIPGRRAQASRSVAAGWHLSSLISMTHSLFYSEVAAAAMVAIVRVPVGMVVAKRLPNPNLASYIPVCISSPASCILSISQKTPPQKKSNVHPRGGTGKVPHQQVGSRSCCGSALLRCTLGSSAWIDMRMMLFSAWQVFIISISPRSALPASPSHVNEREVRYFPSGSCAAQPS